MLRLISACHMRQHIAHVDVRNAVSLHSQCGKVVERQAEPVHAGIDVYGGGPGARPPTQLRARIDHGSQTCSGQAGRISTAKSVKHQNFAIGQKAPQAEPFCDRRNEEMPAAGDMQTPRDGLDAEAVGVRFDHGRTDTGQSCLCQRRVISRECAQIDLDDTGTRHQASGNVTRMTSAGSSACSR